MPSHNLTWPLVLEEQQFLSNIWVFAFQRACPKSDKEENELVMASLRTLYEKKQSNHQHSATQNRAEVTFTHAPAAVVPLLLHARGAFKHHLALSLLWRVLVKVCEKAAPTTVEAQAHGSSQQRLGQLKSRAKRSLTESLEGIWKVLKHAVYLVDPHQPFQKCPF